MRHQYMYTVEEHEEEAEGGQRVVRIVLVAHAFYATGETNVQRCGSREILDLARLMSSEV